MLGRTWYPLMPISLSRTPFVTSSPSETLLYPPINAVSTLITSAIIFQGLLIFPITVRFKKLALLCSLYFSTHASQVNAHPHVVPLLLSDFILSTQHPISPPLVRSNIQRELWPYHHIRAWLRALRKSMNTHS